MNKQAFGFTFVEVLVSISLSMILMTALALIVTEIGKILDSQRKNVFLNHEIDTYSHTLREIFLGNYDVFIPLIPGENYGTRATIINTSIIGKPFISLLGTIYKTGYCVEDRELAFLTIDFLEPFGTGKDGAYSTLPFENTVFSGAQEILSGGAFSLMDQNIRDHETSNISLFHPTGIKQINNSLLISDSGNGRLIHLSGTIMRFLGKEYGFQEPTGILYKEELGKQTLVLLDRKENALLEWKDDRSGFPLEKEFTFSGIEMEQVASITVTLFRYSQALRTVVHFTGNLSFSTGEYFVSGYTLSFSGHSPTFLKENTYILTLTNIQNIPFLPGNYIFSLEIENNFGEKKILYFPYHTYGDGNIFTFENNFFTKIYLSTPYSYAFSGEQVTFLSGNTIHEGNFYKKTTLFSFPIKHFFIKKENEMVHVVLTYYEHYDCMRGNHKEKTRIFKFIQ